MCFTSYASNHGPLKKEKRSLLSTLICGSPLKKVQAKCSFAIYNFLTVSTCLGQLADKYTKLGPDKYMFVGVKSLLYQTV